MDYVLLNDDSGQAGMTANSGACRTILDIKKGVPKFGTPLVDYKVSTISLLLLLL